ncbi:hypothetical protein [Pantoea sp.]|uniref:hypothetical protein n=1 Tax=Pantoea sp. TaxID=69393 RepID=UPI0031D7339E
MKMKITVVLLACFVATQVSASESTPVKPAVLENSFADGTSDANQVRVVYYRKEDRVADGVANLYINGEFHSALLPNSYNVFCLEPGRHFIGAWFNESPHYLGKEAPTQEYHLRAGETVFLRVDAQFNGRSIVKNDQQLRVESAGLEKSIHMLSRATSVIPCQSGVFSLE